MGYYDWYKKHKELAHHGILGQKWGVRRFQNYDGTRIKSVDAEYHRFRTGQKKHYNVNSNKTGMSMFLSKNENRRTAHITRSDGWSGNMEDSEYSYGTFTEGRPFDESLSVVNEMRNKYPFSDDYQNNCVNVATAMIDRRKGCAVAAGPNADGVANEAIGYYFDNTVRETPRHDQVKDTILSHDVGSYGVMATMNRFGIGHEVVWEVNDDKSISIYDGQNDNKYDFDTYERDWGIKDWFGTSVYDLTNATPNMAHQAEDHVFYPKENVPEGNYVTSWRRNGREYNGPSYDD